MAGKVFSNLDAWPSTVPTAGLLKAALAAGSNPFWAKTGQAQHNRTKNPIYFFILLLYCFYVVGNRAVRPI